MPETDTIVGYTIRIPAKTLRDYPEMYDQYRETASIGLRHQVDSRGLEACGPITTTVAYVRFVYPDGITAKTADPHNSHHWPVETGCMAQDADYAILTMETRAHARS